jgi:hypothetical protein
MRKRRRKSQKKRKKRKRRISKNLGTGARNNDGKIQ